MVQDRVIVIMTDKYSVSKNRNSTINMP